MSDSEIRRSSEAAPPGAPLRVGSDVRLELDEQADDDAEQRDAFDQRREDQGVRRDGARDLRLARLTFGGAAADLADADARSDRREARTDTGAEHRPRAGILFRETGRGLEERKNCHISSPRT